MGGLIIGSVLFFGPLRVPNERARTFCTWLQKSNVREIRIAGTGLNGGPFHGDYGEWTFRDSASISKIVEAFKNSHRRRRDSEPGERLEASDKFTFVVESAGKLEESYLFVIYQDIEYHWGLPIAEMYQYLKKKVAQGKN